MDQSDQDNTRMGDWAPTRYPTDEDPSPSPYGPQFPWSGYPAAPTLSDLVDLSPTPTDVILFSSLDTGVGRYYSSVAILPAASSTSELPPYMESIPTRTPEPPPVQTTEVTTPQHEESTISSEIIPADETSESITMTRLATTSPTTTSDLSSIPQNTSDATTDSLTTSPNRDNANHKKLAIAITVPIVIVLLVALGATFFYDADAEKEPKKPPLLPSQGPVPKQIPSQTTTAIRLYIPMAGTGARRQLLRMI